MGCGAGGMHGGGFPRGRVYMGKGSKVENGFLERRFIDVKSAPIHCGYALAEPAGAGGCWTATGGSEMKAGAGDRHRKMAHI